MDPYLAFDNKIKDLNRQYPNSVPSETLNLIKTQYLNYSSYLSLFDSLTHKLGLKFYATELKNGEWRPDIEYLPNNKLGEEPRIENIITSRENLTNCYESLAKGVLYRLSEVRNLNEIIGDIQSESIVNQSAGSQ